MFPLEAGRVPSPTDAALVFLPSVIFLAFYPYARARLVQLRLDGTAYGNTGFRCTAKVKSFYRIYIVASLLVVGLGVVAGFLGAAFSAVAVRAVGANAVMVGVLLVYIAVAALVMAYTQSRASNLVINATALGAQARFRSSLSGRKLFSLYGTNVLAILCTVGFAIPWAVMRTLRYRAQCFALEGEGALDAFASRTADAVGATGEEMGDMFALDVSL
jgi:uncharacterized membrane protein YjgN (DUF898 family)